MICKALQLPVWNINVWIMICWSYTIFAICLIESNIFSVGLSKNENGFDCFWHVLTLGYTYIVSDNFTYECNDVSAMTYNLKWRSQSYRKITQGAQFLNHSVQYFCVQPFLPCITFDRSTEGAESIQNSTNTTCWHGYGEKRAG